MRRFAVLSLQRKRCARLAAVAVLTALAAADPLVVKPTPGRPILRGASSVHAVDADVVAPPIGGLPLVSVWGGMARAVAGERSIVYVAGGHFVEVVDIAVDPPHALGRWLVELPIQTIAVRAGKLYVAAERTLIRYDVRQPEWPVEDWRFELPAPPAAASSRRIVHIAPGDGSIWLSVETSSPLAGLPTEVLVALDETEPDRLRSVAELPVDDARAVTGLWRVGGRLIVATTTTGAGIPFVTHVGAWDVHDLAAPRWVGEAGPFNSFGGAELRDSLLFVFVQPSPQLREQSAERTSGVRVVDVLVADGPTLVGRWEAPPDTFVGNGLTLVGGTAFVGLYDGLGCEVARLDVRSLPPIEVWRRPCAGLPLYLNTAYGDGDRWLATTGRNSGAERPADQPIWEVWSAASDTPRPEGRGTVAHAVDNVVADDGRLLVYDGSTVWLLEPDTNVAQVRVVDPDLGFDVFPNADVNVGTLALAGNRALVTGSSGFILLDLGTTPARRIGEVPWSALSSDGLPQWESAALFGDKVVLGLGWSGFGFTVLDVVDPAHPTRIATPWDDVDVTGIVVSGERLYVAAAWRLLVFERGGPLGLRLVGEWQGVDETNDQVRVSAAGDRVALGGLDTLVLLDVADPAAIHVVAERRGSDDPDAVFFGYGFRNLTVVGDGVVCATSRIYHGAWETGVVYLNGYDLSEIAWRPADLWDKTALAAVGDRVYVAGRSCGLLGYAPWRLPDGWRAVRRLALPWLSR
ncbi:MAG: hypothetical protein ABI780_13985 [Ardenticatenales bacterium]